jgi:hypothetical protein
MAVRKFAISFVEDLESDVREAAREDGLSISAWLAEAARERIRQKHMDAFISAYEREHGEITEDEMNEVCGTWPD